MPPKIKISEEEILEEAILLIREKGYTNLNARDLAKRLGCSVHPIFRAFLSMDGLKEAVYQKVEQIYNNKMIEAGKQEGGFLQMGLAYIDFAKRERNLFQLLFMSEAFQKKSIMDIVGSTQGDDEVIAMICQMSGLSKKGAKELYAGIWLTTHGIAAMFATNGCQYNDNEIKRLLDNSFMGLAMKLKKEEEKLK
ncbi:TetR/AcrR family transcriptional regulator [Candidatus Galacturonibacter soehngenii]|uniref:TetR/AcrR family transcriptional regulator n=1 Tax=Candidatus Galacturonatibacter soehngenii TaxID=2307010 RepID=A0A7V7UBR2_9FIRM|nr:TetR/AcrR family transcriptional regulator [Candidatus Galacturonibacter soehngenii]KAB1438333.1 TetR/AcrR family transcriptional regulator [Candidatus Galacturonibacter soehngenii]